MKSYLIIFALLACTMSGCSQINTKIGMPWIYWEQGILAVVGFLAVCVLIFLGFCVILAIQEDNIGDFVVGIILWIVAGLLLQALPHTESGIQFIPFPPWYYSGWIAWIISAACWLAMILGCQLGFCSRNVDRACTANTFFIALALNGCLSFCSPSNVASMTTPNVASIESCENKTEQWEKNKQQQSELLKKLTHEKEMLESRIKNLGIRTKKELMDHPIAGPLVEELEQLIQQIAKVQNNIVAVESVLSKLRSIEREKALNNAGLSAEELANISQKLKVEILNKSDDQLPYSAVQRDKMLNGLIAQP